MKRDVFIYESESGEEAVAHTALNVMENVDINLYAVRAKRYRFVEDVVIEKSARVRKEREGEFDEGDDEEVDDDPAR